MSLKGKNVVFTGALAMERAEAKRAAEAAGARVHGSVSGTTSIVVAGPGAVGTGKVKAAEAKGVTIWTEANFLAALKGGSAAPKASAAAKRSASASAGPLKRPASAVAPEPTPAAKAAKVAPAMGNSMALHGHSFYRAGAHRYQKALGEFIVAQGGAWTKNPRAATFVLDGQGIMMSSYEFAQPYIKAIEAQIPIVVVPNGFTRGKPTDKDLQSLLKAMKESQAMLPRFRKEGMSSVTIAQMYMKEFQKWWPDYHRDSYVCDKPLVDYCASEFIKAVKHKTGSLAVLKKVEGVLRFDVIPRGK